MRRNNHLLTATPRFAQRGRCRCRSERRDAIGIPHRALRRITTAIRRRNPANPPVAEPPERQRGRRLRKKQQGERNQQRSRAATSFTHARLYRGKPEFVPVPSAFLDPFRFAGLLLYNGNEEGAVAFLADSDAESRQKKTSLSPPPRVRRLGRSPVAGHGSRWGNQILHCDP